MDRTRELLEGAEAKGIISAKSLRKFVRPEVIKQIADSLGDPMGDIPTEEPVLVLVLADDSGSIPDYGNTQNIRDGFNAALAALKGAHKRDLMLMSVRLLNAGLYCPFREIDEVPDFDTFNYDPSGGGTPLWDQTVILLGSAAAKAAEFHGLGVVRISLRLLVVTDGYDEHSRLFSPADCRELAEEFGQVEGVSFTLCGLGVPNANADYNATLPEMGIRPEHIFTPATSGKEMRNSFEEWSQSVTSAVV